MHKELWRLKFHVLFVEKKEVLLINFNMCKGNSQAFECGGLEERLQNQLINKGSSLNVWVKLGSREYRLTTPRGPAVLLSPFRMG